MGLGQGSKSICYLLLKGNYNHLANQPAASPRARQHLAAAAGPARHTQRRGRAAGQSPAPKPGTLGTSLHPRASGAPWGELPRAIRVRYTAPALVTVASTGTRASGVQVPVCTPGPTNRPCPRDAPSTSLLSLHSLAALHGVGVSPHSQGLHGLPVHVMPSLVCGLAIPGAVPACPWGGGTLSPGW